MTPTFSQILLVIISVLLTVVLTLYFTNQSNKKNEVEKENTAKEKLISDLEKAWIADTIHINFVLEMAKQEIASINFLLDNYTTHFSEFDNQTIDYHVHNASHSLAFRPQISVFEVNRYNDKLKLLPDTIQQRIFELYDVIYKRNFSLVELHHSFISNKIDFYLLENAKFIGFSEPSYTLKIDKVNANRLLEDDKFKHYLNYNRTLIDLAIDNYKKSLEKVSLLIEVIEKEKLNIK